jgi:hypothetical protein|tara:strand:+ start:178 stop:690 length:513 start_codon:yes stop_codon:yes gene_type:complete
MDYGMDMYNNGYRSIVDKAINITKNGLVNADTAEEVTFAESVKPVSLGAKAETPKAKGVDVTSVLGKDRTLDQMFGGVVASLAQQVRVDRTKLVKATVPVGTELSTIIDMSGLPATFLYKANMDNTEVENGEYLVTPEAYQNLKAAGLIEDEADRRFDFDSVGLDFPERE